ncbi:hypothetical protein BDN72DRAFT_865170 [Pluteus cervinus]|uniref:Uncharacterized protein n=1 Tax=Pluteus cervinus TaxID=181527 RepID=A0ACD3A1I0_9AGAR|nr:hypothetical protein BDN72DRAFT_865170 [Pluteus cervinus]
MLLGYPILCSPFYCTGHPTSTLVLGPTQHAELLKLGRCIRRYHRNIPFDVFYQLPMLFVLLIASAYKAYALPTPLGPEAFSYTPFTLLYSRSTGPCDCGPQDRSLVDIVRSCVLTIFACVYTALHPNIPDPEAKLWQKICARLKMSFYMLIAPEAVIWWAMRQWYGARQIAREVNEFKPELKWKTTHGHFVQMGGLESIHADGRLEVIDPFLVDHYLMDGRIDPSELRFPKKQVQDRSKGDFLSKGLVALQTSWFVIECIARFQQHLPITELEVVTLAFAVLNIITYGFWWDKPLNVNCQVQIHIKPEASPNRPETNGNREGDGNEVEGGGRQVREANNIRREEDAEDVMEGGDNQEGSQVLMTPMGQGCGSGDETTMTNGRKQKKSPGIGKRLLHLPRWVYDRLIVRPFTALVLPIQDMFKCEDIKKGARHVPMFYGCGIRVEDLLRIRLMSCLIGMIFAGIHFIAWNSNFPTHVELLLWRSSSLVVLVIPFLVGLLGIILGDWDFNPKGNRGFGKWGAVATAILKPIQWVLYILGPILYILARVSLIVQAFISLRDLQPKVFQNVSWTSYIPHL